MPKTYYKDGDFHLPARGDSVLAKTDSELLVWGFVHAGLVWCAQTQTFTVGVTQAFCEFDAAGLPIIPPAMRATLRELYCNYLNKTN